MWVDLMDYKLFWETAKEGVRDRTKLVGSLAVDGYGMASSVSYLFGGVPVVILDAKDIVTSIGQTGWILAAYWGDLTNKQKVAVSALSLLEELGPMFTDVVPSATIAHFVAAYNRSKKELTFRRRKKYLYIVDYRVDE